MVLISVSQIFFAVSKVEKTCHKVSVIHVTQPKLCPIQIVVSDIVVRSSNCNKFTDKDVFYMNNRRTLPLT